MAAEHRNFIAGTLTAELSAAGTVMASGALADLGVVAAGNTVSMTLDPDGTNGAPEIVHVAAHSPGASSASIVRAREGTVARVHPTGTRVVHAVTAADWSLEGITAAERALLDAFAPTYTAGLRPSGDDITLSPAHDHIAGMALDGGTLLANDTNDEQLYAYDVGTGEAQSGNDIDHDLADTWGVAKLGDRTLLADTSAPLRVVAIDDDANEDRANSWPLEGQSSVKGLATTGETVYAADPTAAKIRAWKPVTALTADIATAETLAVSSEHGGPPAIAAVKGYLVRSLVPTGETAVRVRFTATAGGAAIADYLPPGDPISRELVVCANAETLFIMNWVDAGGVGWWRAYSMPDFTRDASKDTRTGSDDRWLASVIATDSHILTIGRNGGHEYRRYTIGTSTRAYDVIDLEKIGIARRPRGGVINDTLPTFADGDIVRVLTSSSSGTSQVFGAFLASTGARSASHDVTITVTPAPNRLYPGPPSAYWHDETVLDLYTRRLHWIQHRLGREVAGDAVLSPRVNDTAADITPGQTVSGGLTVAGNILWYVSGDRLRPWDLAAHAASSLPVVELDAANTNPTDVVHTGSRLLVGDSADGKVYAYGVPGLPTAWTAGPQITVPGVGNRAADSLLKTFFRVGQIARTFVTDLSATIGEASLTDPTGEPAPIDKELAIDIDTDTIPIAAGDYVRIVQGSSSLTFKVLAARNNAQNTIRLVFYEDAAAANVGAIVNGPATIQWLDAGTVRDLILAGGAELDHQTLDGTDALVLSDGDRVSAAELAHWHDDHHVGTVDLSGYTYVTDSTIPNAGNVNYTAGVGSADGVIAIRPLNAAAQTDLLSRLIEGRTFGLILGNSRITGTMTSTASVVLGTISFNIGDEVIVGALTNNHAASLRFEAKIPATADLMPSVFLAADPNADSQFTAGEVALGSDEVTLATVSITPESAHRTVLLIANATLGGDRTGTGLVVDATIALKLYRGSTLIRTESQDFRTHVASQEQRHQGVVFAIDSPATTDPVTYKLTATRGSALENAKALDRNLIAVQL